MLLPIVVISDSDDVDGPATINGSTTLAIRRINLLNSTVPPELSRDGQNRMPTN